MPAERRRSSRQLDRYSGEDALNLTLARARSCKVADAADSTPSRYEDLIFLPESTPLVPEQAQQGQRRVSHNRKKPSNHIPRPPNAFILFRSMFIKSRHVSTGVETNHSTLSKIIGMTWQNLPEEERQMWHARAKIAQDEHKRQFPQYAFKPVHNKARAAERKKIREVGPKDQKRCEKIAELLVSGTKGDDLEAAIQEFDKYHVPQIVTRFDTPITANTFSSTPCSTIQRDSKPVSSSGNRRVSAPRPVDRRSPSRPSVMIPLSTSQETLEVPPSAHYYKDSFYKTDPSPSFEFDAFAFSISQPTPMHSSGDNYTPVVSPMDHKFDSTHNQNMSMLCTHSDYRSAEEWTRQSSPLSNSTSSMPSTPSHMSIPFPEPYSTFTAEATSDYASIVDTSYADYSNYSYVSMPESTYIGIHNKDSQSAPSGFASFQSEAVQHAPALRDDLDFSSLMESLTSYSL